MRWSTAPIGLLLIYLIYGTFLSRFDLRIIPGEIASHDPQGFHDYAGVINIHSNQSTGSGSMSDIIAAAQESGLDFIFFTDLNNFDNQNRSYEGYHDNLLVFVDGEFTFLNSRLLNLGIRSDRDLSGPGRAQVLFGDLLSQHPRSEEQGMLFLAHPMRKKFRWVGEYPPGLDGIEIINLKSLWEEAWERSRASFLWSLLIYPFNDRLALLRLFRDPTHEVRLWDELNSRRPTVGLAGADADARVRISDDYSLQYPSYQTLFGLVRNHVLLPTELTGDETADSEKILTALRRGQFYVSLDILADAKGFLAAMTTAKGDLIPPGAEIPFQEHLELLVELPHRPNVPFEVEIYRDGERIVQSNSQTTKVPIHSPGIYRIKVRVIPTLPLPDGKQWIPWIFSNPFYVRAV